MLQHWTPSKQDWINVGLVGNSFAPNWIDLPRYKIQDGFIAFSCNTCTIIQI